MKLTPYIFSLFLCITASTFAQKEASIWYFGKNAGLDFNSGAPVAITDGALSTFEGCATISNAAGNLLFYTDGITVWNKNHLIMPNGTGLLGDDDSSQSAIIVPRPDYPNIYYVFTVDRQGGSNGMNYSEIDMSLDGGLGAVTGIKNINLIPSSTEKITAVTHSNETDFWVISHPWDSSDFHTYAVTSAGVNSTPVVSPTTLLQAKLPNSSSTDGATGYLKVSPKGNKIGMATFNKGVYVFDFDNQTGIVDNMVKVTNRDLSYGIEFSPSGKRLYATFSPNFLPKFLYQYNMDAADIEASEVLIAEELGIGYAIQLGIDGKIYGTVYNQSFLYSVENPEALGTACNFVFNSVDLNGRIGRAGLPPFIQSFFSVSLDIQNLCLGDITEFKTNSSEPVITVSWDFGDGNTSNLENPTHTYAVSGDYIVSLTVTTASGTDSDTEVITISETPTAQTIGPIEGCITQDSYNLDLPSFSTSILGTQNPDNFTVAYFLSQLDADNNVNPLEPIHPFDFGTTAVYVRVSNNSNTECYATTQFDVVARQAPIVAAITNWTVCDNNADGRYTFDFTLKNDEIFNGQDITKFEILYFASQADADAGINPLPLNYTNTNPVEEVFVRFQNITYPTCYRTGSFTIEVIDGVQANTPMNLQVCDTDNDGFYVFDLATTESEIIGIQDAASVVVSFHNSQIDADSGANPLNANSYTNKIPYQETIYIRVENSANSDCYAITFFDVIVHDSPILEIVTDWYVCDDNNGVFTFNLTEKDAEVLGNQSATDYTVTYHESEVDAQANLNAITGSYQNIQNPQQVYYRIENNANTTCYSTSSFSIEVFNIPIANTPTPFNVCDVDETGSYIFNLTEKNVEILNGQDPSTYFVTYYTTELDALTSTNPLAASTYNSTSQQETLYARVEHNTLQTCYDVTSFEVIINTLPQSNLEEQYVICPDSPDLVINGGNFESWSWKDSQGIEISTNQNLQVQELGTYSVTVTQTTNGVTCENTAEFEVVSSGAPDSFTVDISSFSDEITLVINATGVGTFEYSIDGENYQPDNEFEVFPGEYTVYVRDPYECRTLTEEIIALGYQKFFTPNGDGTHEDWHVIGADSFPESRIYIYNRYGKLLKQLTPNSEGWDGTYLGKPVPSSDYWFRYEYDNGKVFAGHFALKR